MPDSRSDNCLIRLATQERQSDRAWLARELKRDVKSVRRDVAKLERAGVIRTREQVNPGHGHIKLVEPVAREVKLVANL